ncbi:hypothetical protein [Pseudomonas sp. PNPG3]|uniref:hypothetical protein n=1 Tax=Pseudomonas sp. PNPG3 TaxID=2919497 RepID=UPI001FFCCB30|nr:hypothetical protein [Pseudomonas sp. PNPG3]MCK2122109.1 hypothetical protein [Pseudomonas sp. PNPG3]
MAQELNGSFDQLAAAWGQYMNRWFNELYANTKAVELYRAKPFSQAVMWAPSRMIDAAEDMLAAYRKNVNGPDGANSMFPMVLMAVDTNYLGTGADFGGDHISRRLLQIEEGGSWYGYQHSMLDQRLQVVVFASEGASAKSLCAQLSAFIKRPSNRYLSATYKFGQYSIPAPITLETNRIDWMEVKTSFKNMKILAADFILKCTMPHLDAPGEGDPNDGSTNNPPGYPLVQEIEINDNAAQVRSTGTESGVTWGKPE